MARRRHQLGRGGLARTDRVITSAAAIMICVFGAFVLGDLRVLRVIGLGMAAVLLDATLVRLVFTPAAFQLMGRANWWFPSGSTAPSETCSPRQAPPSVRKIQGHIRNGRWLYRGRRRSPAGSSRYHASFKVAGIGDTQNRL